MQFTIFRLAAVVLILASGLLLISVFEFSTERSIATTFILALLIESLELFLLVL